LLKSNFVKLGKKISEKVSAVGLAIVVVSVMRLINRQGFPWAIIGCRDYDQIAVDGD
jgi:hypothetical protein